MKRALFSAISFIALGFSLFVASAFKDLVESVSGGKLPPCPSMFKCSIE